VEVVQAAQLAYHHLGWYDHATLSYVQSVLTLVAETPSLRIIILRLISRVACGWHQGGRSAASVLDDIRTAVARVASEAAPVLLHYRCEHGLCERLGWLGLGEYAPRQVQQGTALAFYAPEYEAAISAADCGIDAYEDGLSTMTLIVAQYVSARYAAFVAQLAAASRGAAASHSLRPPKSWVRSKAKVAESYDDAAFPAPKARHVTDALSADILCNSVEAQLAMWGQLVERLGGRGALLRADNSFAIDDDESTDEEGVGGMQQLQLALLFTPTRDGTDGFVEERTLAAQTKPNASARLEDAVSFTFGDMCADEAGFATALQAAIDANVHEAGEQEADHYRRAAQLLATLPGLAAKPLRLVVELQLHLSFYWQERARSQLGFVAKRAKSLHALAADCAAFRDVSVPPA